MKRRDLFLNLAWLAAWPYASAAEIKSSNGKLLIIGGAEDRVHDKLILKRFLELSGGENSKIVLIVAASSDPAAVSQTYSQAFDELGAKQFAVLPLVSYDDSYKPEVIEQLQRAEGIFMAGGDQSRLMACLWETPAQKAIHRAFHVRGACVAGTSAGAAVMSRQMIAQGPATVLPEKDTVTFDIGLGLINHTIVDQHFSQRRRLGRLLSAIAQRPDLLGVGIDEDTALLIERQKAIEIIGKGAITIVDGRKMKSNFDDIDSEDRLELQGLQLHLLPAPNRYALGKGGKFTTRLHVSLENALQILIAPAPMRG
ncbi:MAG: cyanophycinase [Pseudomonadota bacterium]